jgi:formate dehydrogenase iron-sulfur subunit
MDCDRRDFMRALLLGGAGVVAAPVAEASSPAVSGDSMGVLVDMTKCNGCRRCEAACREANGNPQLDTAALDDPAAFTHRRRLDTESFTVVNRFADERAGGGDQPVYVKSNCLHCLDPACVSACLVGALERQPDGAVTYDASKCIGCRYCMVACPFQVPAYEYSEVLTPRVRKCELCASLRAADPSAAPACVHACPREAITYARRSELLAYAHARIAARPHHYIDHVYGEHEAGGTGWLYLSAAPFSALGFPTLDSTAPARLSEAIQHGVFARFVPPIAWLGILGLTTWLTRPSSAPVAQLTSDTQAAEREDGAQSGVA